MAQPGDNAAKQEPVRKMDPDHRREILLRAYDLERQDERGYWTTIPTLVLSALTITATLTAIAPPSTWQAWIVAPVLAVGIFSFWVQQSAVGARRRWYLEALEYELSGEDELLIDQEFEEKSKGRQRRSIRILFSNRYSWSLAANTGDIAKSWLAKGLFALTFATPGLILAVVIAVSVVKLWSDHHVWSIVVLIVAGLLFFFLACCFLVLADFGARQKSWQAEPRL